MRNSVGGGLPGWRGGDCRVVVYSAWSGYCVENIIIGYMSVGYKIIELMDIELGGWVGKERKRVRERKS